MEEQAGDLKREVSAGDRDKPEEYLASVCEGEKRTVATRGA